MTPTRNHPQSHDHMKSLIPDLAMPLTGLVFGFVIAAIIGFDAVGICLGALTALCMVLAAVVEKRAAAAEERRAA